MNTAYGNVWRVVAIVGVFGLVCWWRDTGVANPQHDEVVSLLAAKGLERQYDHQLSAGMSPFHQIVPAGEWHHFTKRYDPVPFAEIRQDVQHMDRHPPLAFWLLNRWLSLFRAGGYREAVWLTWAELLVAAALLGGMMARLTGLKRAGWASAVLFLSGNSAVFTATWVRQYALLTVFYAATLWAAITVVRRELTRGGTVLALGVLLAMGIGGMTTQYTYAPMAAPIHLAVLGVCARRRQWGRVWWLAAGYTVGLAVFLLLNRDVWQHAVAVHGQMESGLRWREALGGIAGMVVPLPSALAGWCVQGLSLGVLAVIFVAACYGARWGAAGLNDDGRAVLIAGLVGAGIVHVGLVAAGVYPAWGTMPNQLCSFWLVAVAVLVLALAGIHAAWLRRVVGTLAAGMMVFQVLYAWHGHRLVPRVNVSYAARLSPDVVLLDNPARGMVLQVTDVLKPDQKVWVTDRVGASPAALVQSLLAGVGKVLYLPMGEGCAARETDVLAVFHTAGWRATVLPVVHPRLYDAVLLERP